MPKSKASTVEEYLVEIPEERRKSITAVRKVILANLPKGYVEDMQYGMIGYAVPLERHPNTYNGQPLCIAALGAQKNYLVLHLMCVYGKADIHDWFVGEFKKSGKKLDMGLACIRFKKVEDLPLELIGKAIARVSVEQYIDFMESIRKKKK